MNHLLVATRSLQIFPPYDSTRTSFTGLHCQMRGEINKYFLAVATDIDELNFGVCSHFTKVNSLRA